MDIFIDMFWLMILVFFLLIILELKIRYSFKEREYMDYLDFIKLKENCVNYICIKDSNFNV